MRSLLPNLLLSLTVTAALVCPAWSATLTGRVFEDLNRNGILDTGEPCANARVRLFRDTVPVAESRVQCEGNAPGAFFFDLLTPGRYFLDLLDLSSLDLRLSQAALLAVQINDDTEAVLRDLPLVRSPAEQQGGNTIRGSVRRPDATALPGIVVALQDEFGALLRLTTTDAGGHYSFERLPRRGYRVVVADPVTPSGGDALPGIGARRIDADTLAIAVLGDAGDYDENSFVKTGALPVFAPERLLDVGEEVHEPDTGVLSIVRTDPAAPDRDVATIRRVRDDGSLVVADFTGTSVYDLGSSGLGKLLEAGRGARGEDPLDRSGIARLLRVEVARNGQVAATALRADNRQAVYFQGPQGLQRLGFLQRSPDPSQTVELAVSDAGQVAFAGRDEQDRLSVFQSEPGGAGVRSVLNLENTTAVAIRDLQSSARGSLAFRVDFLDANRNANGVILRKGEGRTVTVVAGAGSPVWPQRNQQGAKRPLRQLERPRVGPDGSVLFQGSGEEFRNFYLAPNGSSDLIPLLDGVDWNGDPTTFDYDLAADGVAVIRAARIGETGSQLYLVFRDPPRVVPVSLMLRGSSRPLIPRGRPLFAGDRVFFLASDPNQPPDRDGSPPIGLYRAARTAPRNPPTPVAA
jgi:hypothetical protein